MKYFAEFYQTGVMTGSPTPVCGNDGIVTLDGRRSKYDHMSKARAHAEAKGYVAYQIVKTTDTFTRGTSAVTPVIYI
jgi:hypothetical protein